MPNEAQNAPKMNPIVTPQSRTCEPSIAATQNQSTAAKDENIDQASGPECRRDFEAHYVHLQLER